MLLTDNNYTILSLIRTHKFDDGTLIATNQKYPLVSPEIVRHYKPLSEDALCQLIDQLLTSDESGRAAKEPLKGFLVKNLRKLSCFISWVQAFVMVGMGLQICRHSLLVAQRNDH